MSKPKRVKEIALERNITLRSDGYAYRVRMMANGVRIDETFHTLEEARAFRDRKRSDIALDPTAALVLSNRQAKREASITLGSLLQRYQTEVTPAKRGARAERHRINKLLRFDVAALPIRLVNRHALLQFMRTPEAEWRENNLRKYLLLISHVFTVAVKRWGMELENPVQTIELPSNGPARKRRLNEGEYEALMAALEGCRSKLMAPLARLAIETASRRGELLRLRWEDVDLENRIAILRKTKNGEERVIPLFSPAIETLNKLPKTRSGLVFPLAESRVRIAFEMALKRGKKAYQEQCERQGLEPEPGFLEDLRFHDLRHEATSRLFERGMDVMAASSVTGHKTLSMLKGYTHLRAQKLAIEYDGPTTTH